MNYAMLLARGRRSVTTPFVPPTITITQQPQDTAASAGSAMLSVSASVNDGGNLSYQWQRSTDAGNTWVNVSGATSPSLSLSGLTNQDDNGSRYRVVVGAEAAESITSASATLSVNSQTFWWGEVYAPERLATPNSYNQTEKLLTLEYAAGALPSPEIDSKGFNGLFARITADLNPNNLLNMNGGTAVANSVGPAGAGRSASMQLTIVSGNRMWMGIVDVHSLSASQADGGSYGTSTSETWQEQIFGHPDQPPLDIGIIDYISPGASFYSLSKAFFSLRLSPRITISQQPSDQSASGGVASFSVSASVQDGSTPSYQWQKSDNGGATWANLSGATSASLSLTGLTASDNGDRYRVIVDSPSVEPVTSNAATLTVAAWDISTASYASSFSVGSVSPSAIVFKQDGMKMYVLDSYADYVNEYDLGVAWDTSTASFAQNFSVASQETLPGGLFIKPDGLKVYVTGNSGDDVNEYNLGIAWDISTASYVQNFSVASQQTVPLGVFFKPDGLKMYVVGNSIASVSEYSLSAEWDISTASYFQTKILQEQDYNPHDIFFKPDGLKMYVIDEGGRNVNEYNLGIAWDISTASYVQGFNVAAQEISPGGVFFKPDGLKMYLVGSSSDSVHEYEIG